MGINAWQSDTLRQPPCGRRTTHLNCCIRCCVHVELKAAVHYVKAQASVAAAGMAGDNLSLVSHSGVLNPTTMPKTCASARSSQRTSCGCARAAHATAPCLCLWHPASLVCATVVKFGPVPTSHSSTALCGHRPHIVLACQIAGQDKAAVSGKQRSVANGHVPVEV